MTLQKPRKPATLGHLAELTRRRGVRQFVKFALVGASSTAITYIVLYLALTLLHGHRFISTAIAFVVAVGNGYFWNKRWTFREAQVKAAHTQFAQFLLVNLVGLALTELIMFLIAAPVEYQIQHLRPLMSPDRVTGSPPTSRRGPPSPSSSSGTSSPTASGPSSTRACLERSRIAPRPHPNKAFNSGGVRGRGNPVWLPFLPRGCPSSLGVWGHLPHSITASTWTASFGRRSSRTVGRVIRLAARTTRKASL